MNPRGLGPPTGLMAWLGFTNSSVPGWQIEAIVGTVKTWPAQNFNFYSKIRMSNEGGFWTLGDDSSSWGKLLEPAIAKTSEEQTSFTAGWPAWPPQKCQSNCLPATIWNRCSHLPWPQYSRTPALRCCLGSSWTVCLCRITILQGRVVESVRCMKRVSTRLKHFIACSMSSFAPKTENQSISSCISNQVTFWIYNDRGYWLV